MPCSIWMPPAASGPVFTVRSPILTGFGCAKAGVPTMAAVAAVPTRKFRRVILGAIVSSFGELAESLRAAGGLAGDLQAGGLVGHLAADGHVTNLLPEAIDLGQDRLVRLLDVDRVGDGHPARTPCQPEHLGAVALGIEEVA